MVNLRAHLAYLVWIKHIFYYANFIVFDYISYLVQTVKKSHISSKPKKATMTDDILNIFVVAQTQNPLKKELTLDEITAAYYNLVTKETPGAKIKTKKDIALKLFMMRGQKKNNGKIELVPGSRGLYRLRSKDTE